jgi:hypothetical protein
MNRHSTLTLFLFLTSLLLQLSNGIITDDDFLDHFDPVKYDPVYDVTVFDPGSDIVVSAPGGLNRSLMVNAYGTVKDTENQRLLSMETPSLCLYNKTLFNDQWISEYDCSGTYQLSVPFSIPAKNRYLIFYRSTNRNSYLKYFKGSLWIIGAWAFCPGPPWSNTSNPLAVQDCILAFSDSIIPQPWINSSLGAPNIYARGVAGESRDGGKSWKIVVADPRLARLGSNAVIVNGSDGTIDAAMCLVGGTILPPYEVFTRDAEFPITDSVLCTYDGSNWWENAPLPTPSAEHSLVSIGSSILVVGGLRPRNISSPVVLNIQQDFMTDPPLLVSIVSDFPCSLGAQNGGACIAYKGWAGFKAPPLARNPTDFLPRCTPVAFFLPGRGNSIYKQNSFEFTPRLYIGGGNTIYNTDDYGKTENFKDMSYLEGDLLSFEIKTLAERLFADDPSSGIKDTFNNSLSEQLGSWKLIYGSIPPAINNGNVFMHEITFPNGSDPCLSNSIITSICFPGDYFSAQRPMYIIIAGQYVYSDFFGELLESIKSMPVTQLTTIEPSYVTDPLYKLDTFYGQKVSELPSYGVKYPVDKFSNAISDSILISPVWNEGQPVIYFLQGGMRLLAAHFARCIFQHCTPGEEYPVTCQNTPRDASCKPCKTCSGNITSNNTFTRRQCSYEISYLSRLPSVVDTVCEPCTNCTAIDADFISSCSVQSDATCTPRVISPTSPPRPSSDIQNWREWLFKEQPFDFHSGPFLGKLSRLPLDIGSSAMALLTIAFIVCLFRLSHDSSLHNERQYNSEDQVKNLSINHLLNPGHSLSFHISPDSETQTTSTVNLRRKKITSLIFSYFGFLFFFLSLSFVFSLPEELITGASTSFHFVCGLGGIFFSNVVGSICFRHRNRKVISAPKMNRQAKGSYSRYVAIGVLIISFFNPLCLTLFNFTEIEFQTGDIQRIEASSGIVTILNALVQMVLFSVAVYYFKLSIFLWPVFLLYLLSIFILGLSIYLVQSRTFNYATELVHFNVESVTTEQTSAQSVKTESEQSGQTHNTLNISQRSCNPGALEESVLKESTWNIETNDSRDLDSLSVIDSIDDTADSYSVERNVGLSHIQVFAAICEEEDVTGLSVAEHDQVQAARKLRVKQARRASAPSQTTLRQ